MEGQRVEVLTLGADRRRRSDQEQDPAIHVGIPVGPCGVPGEQRFDALEGFRLRLHDGEFNEQLRAKGTLDRLPEDLSYTIVRGFQIHDFLHVMTGFSPKPVGELAQAGFHYAQLRFPYHAIRVAATTVHVAFVKPEAIVPDMDAMCAGWAMGRAAENLHFTRWEDELDTPLVELRERVGIDPARYDSF